MLVYFCLQLNLEGHNMNLERLKLIALNVPDLTLCTEPVSLVMIPSTNQLLVQLNHSRKID